MGHRTKHKHKPRHHTHAVKPASLVKLPLPPAEELIEASAAAKTPKDATPQSSKTEVGAVTAG